MLTLLSPRYRAVRNRFGRLAPGDGLKSLMLIFLGLAFWALLYAVAFRVLTYFRSIEGLGDLLAIRLLSMVLLTFFSIPTHPHSAQVSGTGLFQVEKSQAG